MNKGKDYNIKITEAKLSWREIIAFMVGPWSYIILNSFLNIRIQRKETKQCMVASHDR